MSSKKCTKCNIIKPVEEFQLHRRNKTGKVNIKSRCKECLREDCNEYYTLNSWKMNEPTFCSCGEIINKQNMKRHLTSKKHQRLNNHN